MIPSDTVSLHLLFTASLRKTLSLQNVAQIEVPWEGVTLNRCLFIAITILVLTSGCQRLNGKCICCARIFSYSLAGLCPAQFDDSPVQINLSQIISYLVDMLGHGNSCWTLTIKDQSWKPLSVMSKLSCCCYLEHKCSQVVLYTLHVCKKSIRGTYSGITKLSSVFLQRLYEAARMGPMSMASELHLTLDILG